MNDGGGTDAAGPSRFPIRIEPRYRLLLRAFGVRDGNAWVDLGTELHARFGWFEVRTSIANCVRWSIEGPWRAITALGVRRGFRGGDVTFAGTPRGGVRVDFLERVPFGFFSIPTLYLTVEDLDGFTAALAARGIPGEDRRDPSG